MVARLEVGWGFAARHRIGRAGVRLPLVSDAQLESERPGNATRRRWRS
jgi:hypothetical protein